MTIARSHRPYSLASARIVHGGRSAETSQAKHQRIALMPMRDERRGWLDILMGRKA